MAKLIALIDDQPEMEDLFTFILEEFLNRGLVTFRYFPDATQFLKWLPTNNPDLILTDISMPVIDGPSLLGQIRKTGRNIPAYFVSGHEEEDYRTLMQDLSVERFLAKPFNLGVIARFIETDLGILAVAKLS